MKYLKISNPHSASGFTIVEIIVVMALILVLFGISAPFLYRFYNNFEVRSERDSLVAYLRQTRNISVADQQQSNHGLYKTSTQYIIFKGSSYSDRDPYYDQIFPRSTGVAVSGPSQIVFQRRSGRTPKVSYTLTSGGTSYVINVNEEGNILW